MEPWRMSLSRSCIREQQFVLRHVVALLVIFCCAVTGANSLGNFQKIFLIGDSFLDIANRDPINNTRTVIGKVNQPWRVPFGRTYPGSPAGRFSDGKCLGDLLADSLGLNPRPYRVLSDNSQPTSVNDGVNLAVGGAGVFDNLGFTKTGDQIAQLQQILNTGIGGPYNPTVLSKSLIVYGISGNDYAAFLRANAGDDIPTLTAKTLDFVGTVVAQATKDLEALYNLGFRKFVVGKLPPLGCLPASTINKTTGFFTGCNDLFNFIATTHNTKLAASVTLALPPSRGADIIFLNNEVAFSKAINTVTNSGPPASRLLPCCIGFVQSGTLCGDVDALNNNQYTLCNINDQGKYFFWDEFHPTEAGWKTVFKLFLDDSFFIGFPGGFPWYLYTDGKSLKRFLGV